MCAKVMLNMKKTIQMSDFIPNGVGKILHFTEKCMESRASKLFIKSCIWLNQQTQRMNDFFSSGFVLMLVCSLAQKFYHRLARSTYKTDFRFSNFALGVSHSQKCYVMFQYHLTETKETELWIDLLKFLVAFFDLAALFSDFNLA